MLDMHTLPTKNVNRLSPKPRRVKARKPCAKAEEIGVDVSIWMTACGKLSLRESGELIRALIRAQRAKRPNRDQRMLLAVFTRDCEEGKSWKA
jgi:hypothetical protein